MQLRPILHFLGLLLLALAATMVVPALVDLAVGGPDWQVFLATAAGTAFIAVNLVLAFRVEGPPSLTIRDAFLVTTASWATVSVFASLPLIFSDQHLSFTDAVFETVSGVTTTGSTVMVGLDDMPASILLWRAMMQWFGGAGIIVMAIAILPFLRIGGMQLFRTESSDRSEKVTARLGDFMKRFLALYAGLTALCAAALVLVDVSAFDAVCHAMASLATGGFSTYDSSVGAFDNAAAEAIIILFMMVGSLPFPYLILSLAGRPRPLLADQQARSFVATTAVFVALLAAWQVAVNGAAPLAALRTSAFNVVSVVTTTGFATTDYQLWGPFAVVCFFVLTVLGGCTGSTAGGIKFFRWWILFSTAQTEIRRLVYPRGVFLPRFNGQPVEDGVIRSVLAFVFLYLLCMAAIAIGAAAFGVDPLSALSGAAQALGNVGPGLGDVIGPAGNFATLPDGAKWLFAIGMLLGRLELFTILVLFSSRFWRT